ncbi:hypothetical protein GY21_03965 [Cryobacterium roopkundense]|uniref:DUF3105 domain-containing protein n=1 Tax=Cryobacterium roopkundense TaxID=1001240 RepID=A0A099JNF7_9MICO|nr:DUF3105 domain-containing protein [Cryobacterium roopkundense]KGJ79691.1 hypothetical protein GY21_03965 [Cryobacterium roopkundense]MBB5642673.1 hypothetical protein [Cryobacterium roopkundense]
MPQPGSPVNKATVKEQRAQQRAKKLEVYHRQQKRSLRNRRIGITSAIVGAVAVIGLVVTMVVLTPQAPNYAGGGDGAEIDGVLTYENGNGHVETTVDYEQTPPVGGEHNPAWLNCGIYEEPVPSENAVHSLEHGAIWVTYDASMSADELDALKALMPSNYVVLSPFDGLPSPIVLSGWNVQLQVETAEDPRIASFFEQYWKSGTAPELGASCSGAIDAPGKVS